MGAASVNKPDELVSKHADGVATITLNRPDAINAINARMRELLPAAVLAAEENTDVRVILIRGAGPRGFCSGADIGEFAAPGSSIEARAIKRDATWIDVLAEARKPTVAAIHGYCLGGGLEIAAACDIRIAAEDAAFGLPEVSLAIIPGAGGTQRVPRIIGLGHALRLIMTGERIDAATALRIGLVSDVVPGEQLGTRAAELTQRLARFAPQAVAYAKEAVRRGSELPLAEGLRLERDLSAVLMATEDRIEAASAFRERREPVFRGR
jgi:enoyl-CoA hydratase/carnithine racemase